MIETFNASWLLEQDFPPLQYAVRGIIPEGMTLLAGGPKVGKSWFVLDLAYAAATGGSALGGIPVEQRPVLYLALEDGQRRLQSRLRTLGYVTGGKDLHFVVTVDQEHPPEEIIRAYLHRNSGTAPLVILDTLGKVMPPARPSEGAYERDYRVAGGLKRLVDVEPGSSLVVVHHVNKGVHGDFVDKVSGTNGIAGAADSILVLARDRDETTATLSVTSRDAAEGIYQVEQPEVGRWVLSGGSLEDARAAYQQAKATEGVGEVMTELIEIVSKHPEGIRRKDIAAALGGDDGTLGKNLRRAVESGRLRSPSRGTYTPATSATSATLPGERPTECGTPSASATFQSECDHPECGTSGTCGRGTAGVPQSPVPISATAAVEYEGGTEGSGGGRDQDFATTATYAPRSPDESPQNPRQANTCRDCGNVLHRGTCIRCQVEGRRPA